MSLLLAPEPMNVVTLSSSNLRALAKAEADLTKRLELTDKLSKESVEQQIIEISEWELFKNYCIIDFSNNFTIVSVPAFFTNFLWRLMNLYGVAVSHSFWLIIVETTLQIAPVIFVTCFIIDACRQCYLHQTKYAYSTYTQLWEAYYDNWGTLSSLHLAFKFFVCCVGWTLGYVLVADDHQIYADKSDSTQIWYRALGAGLGSFFGLVLASEIIALSEYYSGVLVSMNRLHPYSMSDLHYNQRKGFCIDTNQRGIFGVGFKGFCEGVAWSLLAALDLYLVMQNKGFQDDLSIILDSLTVGIFAGLFFSIGGLWTSFLGYTQGKYQEKYQMEYIDESILEDHDTNDDELQPLI